MRTPMRRRIVRHLARKNKAGAQEILHMCNICTVDARRAGTYVLIIAANTTACQFSAGDDYCQRVRTRIGSVRLYKH